MDEAAESGSVTASAGEAVGGFLAGIPPAIGDFFSGVGQGAGVAGLFDWAALIVGIALLLSVIRGVRRGRIVGPAIRGVIGVALMGWAVS
jgi:hypothetical protein